MTSSSGFLDDGAAYEFNAGTRSGEIRFASVGEIVDRETTAVGDEVHPPNVADETCCPGDDHRR